MMVNVKLDRLVVFRFIPIVVSILVIGTSSPTRADNRPVACVLELFTSQGCSSCPAADRLLGAIARKPDVVAISLPVDYWDYIGWKDTLASPNFTARQKAYATVLGSRHVYTPEAIVNGVSDAIGSDGDAIQRAITTTRGHADALSLKIKLVDTGDRLVVEVPAGVGGPAGVFLLRVLRARTVQIGRGENAGRSVTYTNVVRAMEQLGEWTGNRETFEAAAPRNHDEGYVVLVQRGTPDRPGAILAAAKTAGL
jgi:hypothetical protein